MAYTPGHFGWKTMFLETRMHGHPCLITMVKQKIHGSQLHRTLPGWLNSSDGIIIRTNSSHTLISMWLSTSQKEWAGHKSETTGLQALFIYKSHPENIFHLSNEDRQWHISSRRTTETYVCCMQNCDLNTSHTVSLLLSSAVNSVTNIYRITISPKT